MQRDRAGCSVLCLRLKTSLCSCPCGRQYGRIVVFRYLLRLRRDVISGNRSKSAFFQVGTFWG